MTYWARTPSTSRMIMSFSLLLATQIQVRWAYRIHDAESETRVAMTRLSRVSSAGNDFRPSPGEQRSPSCGGERVEGPRRNPTADLTVNRVMDWDNGRRLSSISLFCGVSCKRAAFFRGVHGHITTAAHKFAT